MHEGLHKHAQYMGMHIAALHLISRNVQHCTADALQTASTTACIRHDRNRKHCTPEKP